MNLNFVKRAYLKRLANKFTEPKEPKKLINAKDQEMFELKNLRKYF